MSYIGIGATDPNHPLEVEGQVFISNVEQGSTTNLVPFEVYSDYDGVADNAVLQGARQLRLRVTPSATTTSNVNIDMGIESKGGDYFYISNPVVDTELGSNTAFRIVQAGHVEVGSNLSVTGNVVASNIVGGSPLTISTGSNVQIMTSNVGIGTVPLNDTRVHIQGGSTASITNSNALPNFIFSRNSNAAVNHIGGGHACARHVVFPDEDGKAWSVGGGYDGCLGLGDTRSRNTYHLISTLDGVANIVASSTSGYSAATVWETTSLLDDTGNVWTCGQNEWGLLGLGDVNDRYAPTLVTTNIYNVSITEVSVGTAGSLVLDSTGQIWGAGYNVDWRLGDLSGAGAGTTHPTYIPTYPGSQGQYSFTSIDIGEGHSLALQDNGQIWSTGGNQNGRTGQGTNMGNTAGWTTVSNAGGVNDVSITQISNGELYSMARDSTGNVWMTGHNAWGELGLGDTTNKWHFIKVTTNVNVASGVTALKIAAAVSRSYVLDTNGKMWGSGWNTNGNFGQPPYAGYGTITTFIRADTGPIADKSITDFALTSYTSVIVRTSDNEYWVTGWGGGYGLGTGDSQDRFAYTKIRDVNANPPPDYGYTRSLLLENTETGKGPSIEFKNSDAVSSRIQMEDGTSGKLNIGFVDASFDPKMSGGDGAQLYPFQDFAQSNTMTRGVTIDQAGGTMVAGGSTSNIGLNTPIFSSGRPGSGNYGYDMGCGDQYATAFVSTDGKIYIAGNNGFGAYGDGTTVSSQVFIDVTPGGSSYPFVAVVDGNQFTYALDSQGNSWKTGINSLGQLGLGDTTTRLQWVDSGDDIYGVAVGGSFTILNASTGSGSLYVSGSNAEGQIGLGGTSYVTGFTQVTNGAMSGRSVRSVWASVYSSFVICTDNTLIASGRNNGGLLGTNTTPGVNITTYTVCPNTNFSGKVPVQVSSTYEHSLMLTSDGQVYATGSGSYYRTGLNSTSDVQVFTRCTGAIQSYTITRVAVRTTGSFALDSTGNVWSCGQGNYNGLISTADTQEFTKITVPEEFYSRTIVNLKPGYNNSVYAVDSEGVLWGMGVAIRGTGGTGASDMSSSIFTKIPLTNMPSALKYTPTLTLENPNADYGATVEFK
ncbi:MAG: RCC1 domain-containing protein, partial [Sedimenticolaceae bacterium]